MMVNLRPPDCGINRTPGLDDLALVSFRHRLEPNTMTRNSAFTGVVRYVRRGCSGSAKHVLHHLITLIFLSLEVSVVVVV